MKLQQSILVGALMAALAISVQAQDQPNRDRGGDRGNRPDRGRFDPAQMRERMMSNYKEQLEVTDEAEWKAIEPRIEKVMETRRASMSGAFGGMRGMFGGGPGGPGGFGGPRPGGDDNQRGGGFGQANPEMETLNKAVEGKASNAELKAAIAKYQDARKAKQAEVEKAQDELRKVLSVRQEAIATLRGLL